MREVRIIFYLLFVDLWMPKEEKNNRFEISKKLLDYPSMLWEYICQYCTVQNPGKVLNLS